MQVAKRRLARFPSRKKFGYRLTHLEIALRLVLKDKILGRKTYENGAELQIAWVNLQDKSRLAVVKQLFVSYLTTSRITIIATSSKTIATNSPKTNGSRPFLPVLAGGCGVSGVFCTGAGCAAAAGTGCAAVARAGGGAFAAAGAGRPCGAWPGVPGRGGEAAAAGDGAPGGLITNSQLQSGHSATAL